MSGQAGLCRYCGGPLSADPGRVTDAHDGCAAKAGCPVCGGPVPAGAELCRRCAETTPEVTP